MKPGRGKQLVEQTLCSITTSDALLSLIQGYAKDSRSYDSLINETLRNIAIGQESIEGMGSNIYEEYSADVGDLRQKLFAMTDNDQAEADIAIKCLVQLDCIYDEHGYPASDARHPDITLGRAWPIVKHDDGE